MKRLLSILAAGAMLTAAVPFNASALNPAVPVTDEQFANSDFNNDGVVDMIDAYMIMYRYCELAAPCYCDFLDGGIRETIDKYGNYNDNEIVTARDAALLVGYMKDHSIELYQMSDEEAIEKLTLAKANISAVEGDINQDDSTDARDASILLSYYADSQVSKPIVDADEVSAYFNGDVTGDGAVDARDASAVLDIYAKNSTK